MKKIIAILLLYLFETSFVSAQANIDSGQKINSTAHFQLSVISQSHLSFKSPYSGENSLSNNAQLGATSITSTLFFGEKLWKGSSFYFDPEISGGEGLSGSLGVAGALNGETYRVGNPAPSFLSPVLIFNRNFRCQTRMKILMMTSTRSKEK